MLARLNGVVRQSGVRSLSYLSRSSSRAAGVRGASAGAGRGHGAHGAMAALGACATLGAVGAASLSLAGTEARLEEKEEESNVLCLEDQPGLGSVVRYLMGWMRDQRSDQEKFVQFADRIFRVLMEVAIADLNMVSKEVETPTGAKSKAYKFENKVAAVSILRSGDALMNSFLQCMPGSPTGKLLLVKHEVTDPGESDFEVLFSRMPKDLHACQVLLFDPMLATGSTFILALRYLKEEHDVDPANVVIISLISCKEGLDNVTRAFPDTRVVTAAIDPGLDESEFVSPGLGSFGDRYFGTR